MPDVNTTQAAPKRARLIIELMDDGSVKIQREGDSCLLWRYLAAALSQPEPRAA